MYFKIFKNTQFYQQNRKNKFLPPLIYNNLNLHDSSLIYPDILGDDHFCVGESQVQRSPYFMYASYYIDMTSNGKRI